MNTGDGARRLTSWEVVFYLATFLPGFLLHFWLERALVVVVVAIAAVALAGHLGEPVRGGRAAGRLFWAFFCVEWLYVLAFLVSQSRFAPGIGFRDLIEVPRYAVWAVFVPGLTLFRFDKRIVERFEVAIIGSYLYSLFVFAAYVVHVPVLSSFLVGDLYANTKNAIQLGGWVRLAAPFGNPNFLAFYLVLTLAYWLFFCRARIRALAVVMALCLTYLTGSRSGWGASSIVLVIFGASAIHRLGVAGRRREAAAAALGVCALVAIAVLNHDAISGATRVATIERAIKAGEIGELSDVAGRINMTIHAWHLFTALPVTGWGGSKVGVASVIDSQYLLWLVRNGVAGTALIGVIIVSVFLSHWRKASEIAAKYGVVAFWGGAALMLATGAFIDNFQLGFIFCLLVALISWRLRGAKANGNGASRSAAVGMRCGKEQCGDSGCDGKVITGT